MISVIIPNYNHSKYLKDRIESVLNQSFSDFELIILDDKSTDDSREIIEKYRNHPNVTKIVYNETNSGTTFKQWNKGVSLASGDYIWIAESDDVAEPTLLQTLYDKITESSNATMAFCQSYRMNHLGEVTGDWFDHTLPLDKSGIFQNDFILNGHNFIKSFLIQKNVIPNTSAVLFKKEAYILVGEANTEIGYIGDWLVWLKLATIGNVAYSCKTLNYFRYHDKSYVVKSFANLKTASIKWKHLDLRSAYRHFLLKTNYDTSLTEICQAKFDDDLFIEARFLFYNKKYIQALKYIFLIIIYSEQKTAALLRIYKSIRN